MSPKSRAPDWVRWLERWDAQQTRYLAARERRFQAMFDVLEAHLGARFIGVDLACGPGSLSQRMLGRFPQARSIAVDYDPVLLALGQHALAPLRDRIAWVEADLRDALWRERLPVERVDAVLSTTALHWLSKANLERLYVQVHGLLRPGGVLLNGDHMAFAESMPTFRQIARSAEEAHRHREQQSSGAEDWSGWWAALEREPSLGAEFAERRRRFPKEHDEATLTTHQHELAMRGAGFAEVGVIWREFDNLVLLAVR